MTTKRRIALLGAAAALAIGAAACARGTTSLATPSFTATQATAGERAYQGACVACHTTDLGGSGEAPALSGPAFARRWNGRPVADLTAFAREHMPRTVPGVLNDRTYLALIAYLLARNGVPVSATPLTFESNWTMLIGSR